MADTDQQKKLDQLHAQYPDDRDGGLLAKLANSFASDPTGISSLFGGRNPLVPLGALLTAGVLVRGVTAMYQGDKVMSQKMMRARIGMQGVTVMTVATGALSARYMANQRREAQERAERMQTGYTRQGGDSA